MGIECRLVIKRLPDGLRQLYFRHHRLVPFYETASSGTLALVHLYRRLIPRDWESRSGSLTSLCNATPRELREGHNLEKMYISGEFEKYE